MTWYQVGIVSKELLEIGWLTNVFLWITAVLAGQVGFAAHTRQSLKVWSLVVTGTSQTNAVTGVTILQSGTVELSSCMSYKSRLDAIFVIVVTATQVICHLQWMGADKLGADKTLLVKVGFTNLLINSLIMTQVADLRNANHVNENLVYE